jgi:predicted O-linked N-acetylglucosamine transferase (SPINDLY family)
MITQANLDNISTLINTDPDPYNVYNVIKLNLEEKNIDNNIYIQLLNKFIYVNHVFDTRVHDILINLFKIKFNIHESQKLTDDILFKNITNNNSNIEKMLIVYLLIKPIILSNSKLEIINHNCRVLNNINKLLYEESLHNIINTVDEFYYMVIVNYNYYHVYNGLNNKDLYIKITKLYRLICPDLTFNYIQTPIKLTNQDILNKKIKIGFASDILVSDTSVCNDRIGIISSLILDDKYEVYIFTKKEHEGEIYKFVINSTGFKNKILLQENISEARNIIANHRLDILVYPEIGMDIFYYYLAYSRLAPIQINTWGHSETSGIDTIDYYFSSKYYEILETQARNHYSEKLVCLDSICTYYYSLRIYDFYQTLNESTQNSNLLYYNLPKCCNIYGIFQTVFKYNYNIIKIIKNILFQDPKALILILTYNRLEEVFINYLNKHLGFHVNRIRIFKRHKLEKYCKLIKCVDIILDSYPFGGCNTSLQAFCLGKVVMTLPTNKINGRFTAGFYKKMDITEPICSSIKEYVDKSIYYVNNKIELRKLEEKIINNRFKLFEEESSIITWKNKLEELYKLHK